MILEQWVDIPEWKGLYQVSNLGRIRSLDRIVKGRHPRMLYKGRIIVTDRGSLYPVVTLVRGKQKLHENLHALVLRSFVGPRPVGMEACHNNGDKKDSRLENLRWDTPQANHLDRRIHGVRRNRRGPKQPKLILEELRFILNELTTSMDYGAEDPLFEQCAIKLRKIIAWEGL